MTSPSGPFGTTLEMTFPETSECRVVEKRGSLGKYVGSGMGPGKISEVDRLLRFVVLRSNVYKGIIR